MSHSGTLQTFKRARGFGFIERDDGQEEVFVHCSKLTNGCIEDMVEGARMRFDTEINQRNGKVCATNVTIESGGCASGERRGDGPVRVAKAKFALRPQQKLLSVGQKQHAVKVSVLIRVRPRS